MKRKLTKNVMYTFTGLASLLIALSCTDKLENYDNHNQVIDKDALIFELVTDNDSLASTTTTATATTRACVSQQQTKDSVASADFSVKLITAKMSDKGEAYLVENTVEGISSLVDQMVCEEEPQPIALTRGKVQTRIDRPAAIYGHRGTSVDKISESPNWFYDHPTDKQGKFISTEKWKKEFPAARFYGIFPRPKISAGISEPQDGKNYKGRPQVNFRVKENVREQEDFMACCSGNIYHKNNENAPEVRMHFRHMLTAINFAVGDNLSWAKIIRKIEIQNACTQGKLLLPEDNLGRGAKWSNLDKRTTVALDNLNISTQLAPNSVITGRGDDNYTFFMIPQRLTGANVKAVVYFTDNTKLVATLKGEWKSGTTKTYKLSDKDSNWEYVFTSEYQRRLLEYNETVSEPYAITSYRQLPGGKERQPIEWEVEGYLNTTDLVLETSFSVPAAIANVESGVYVPKGKALNAFERSFVREKPNWIKSMTDKSKGSISPEKGNFHLVKASLIDKVSRRNEQLSKAALRGQPGNEYDLSLHDIKGNKTLRNTANCYVISAPGYYKIPLVYGNGLKNGQKNEKAYYWRNNVEADTDTWNFAGKVGMTGDRDSYPWIFPSGRPEGEIVWADESNLVSDIQIRNISGKGYMTFKVTPENIKQGNAEIALIERRGGGNQPSAFWSWHFWFAPDDVLDGQNFGLSQVLNRENVVISNENLGWKYTECIGTEYNVPRVAYARLRQKGSNKIIYLRVDQNSYLKGKGYGTLYQWGRHMAFPGIENIPVSTPVMIHRENSSSSGMDYNSDPYIWKCNNRYDGTFGLLNGMSVPFLWDISEPSWAKLPGFNNPPIGIKSVLDPCPVGYQVPPSSYFRHTRYETVGGTLLNIGGVVPLHANVKGSWDNGYHFYTQENPTRVTPTAFFPTLKCFYVPEKGEKIKYGEMLDLDYAHAYAHWVGDMNNLYLYANIGPTANSDLYIFRRSNWAMALYFRKSDAPHDFKCVANTLVNRSMSGAIRPVKTP